MKIIISVIILCSIFVVVCTDKPGSNGKETDLAVYVDPYIGTDYHGHVFLGANVPFGAVQLGPTNFISGWDWCSGYHYSDSLVTGFSHLHLSGTGIGDLGDILVMPYTGQIKLSPGTPADVDAGYASRYNHEQEKVSPGYYSVNLQDYDIKAELSASKRVGIHKYTFPKSDNAHFVIDLVKGIGWDSPVESFIEQVDDTTLVGYRFSKGWSTDQRVYFTILLSKPLSGFSVYDNEKFVGTSGKGKSIKAVSSFSTLADQVIKLKVGISPVSSENARENIKTEIPHWNFDNVVEKARAAWNTELNKITIKTNNEAHLRTFYTALYHTMIAPILFNDVNGDYRGTDKKVYKNAHFQNYTVFSLWDTYRAAHPLYTLFQPDRVKDMVNSMLAIDEQQGKLPVWHLMGCETNTMVGYHAVPVIVDACFKGIAGVDQEKAFKAIKRSAMRDERGLKYLKKIGYIPADKEVESVAKSLEYAIDDWCIAQMAKKLNRTKDYDYFLHRSRAYEHYFDASTHFMRGKMSDGTWRRPFNPIASTHRNDDYCEGNAWQYTWLVSHDVEGLINLFGDSKQFTEKLDSLFIIESTLLEGTSPDISGLIGQYAHGNEPGHHIPYLYAFVGQQWKTAEKVRQIMNNFYTDKPDGLCGNEDCGQMSAWYIFSALGFYPVNPANGAYVFGSPLFDQAELSLPGGKSFKIIVKNNGENNIYIQSIKLNGKTYSKAYITHKDIMRGGRLEIVMGPEPGRTFAVDKNDFPTSGLYY